MSQEEWLETIDVVRNFGPTLLDDANEAQIEYRSNLEPATIKKWGKKYQGEPMIRLFKVEEYYVENSDSPHYHLYRLHKRKNREEKQWLICVPQMKVFDAILE